jgi:gluconolactonase
VVRYDLDVRATSITDKYNGKQRNSPNDIVAHPGGGVWFTDLPSGILGNYEGVRAMPELKEPVYRVDPGSGKIEIVTDELKKPSRICFSADYRKGYICDTGAPKDVQVFDLADNKLRNKR